MSTYSLVKKIMEIRKTLYDKYIIEIYASLLLYEIKIYGMTRDIFRINLYNRFHVVLHRKQDRSKHWNS